LPETSAATHLQAAGSLAEGHHRAANKWPQSLAPSPPPTSARQNLSSNPPHFNVISNPQFNIHFPLSNSLQYLSIQSWQQDGYRLSA
jgi:hypothetical protein